MLVTIITSSYWLHPICLIEASSRRPVPIAISSIERRATVVRSGLDAITAGDCSVLLSVLLCLFLVLPQPRPCPGPAASASRCHSSQCQPVPVQYSTVPVPMSVAVPNASASASASASATAQCSAAARRCSLFPLVTSAALHRHLV